MKKIMLLAILLFLEGLQAGDKAQFLSLGFSPDGKYFAFSQYGIQDGSGFPYADIYIVNVEKNTYVAGGVYKNKFDSIVDPRTEGLHVLLELRIQADSLFRLLQIESQKQGITLYQNKMRESINISWTNNKDKLYKASLEQISKTYNEIGVQSAFHLILEQSNSTILTIGDKQRFRPYVRRYDIDRVITNHEQTSYVFVIQMTRMGFEGPDIRYMVETVRLP